jgi:hypothetical protein
MATTNVHGAAAGAQNLDDRNQPPTASSPATTDVETTADDDATDEDEEKIYRFWSGNADTVFFNARIRARSPEEALDILQRCFGGLEDIYPADGEGADQVEEAEVYLATYNMTVEDILEEEAID